MKVVWSAESLERLADIKHYIEKDDPLAAHEQIERLLKRGESLATVAKRGRRVPEYPELDLRELLDRPYRLIYRIDEKLQVIQIQTVMHYRRNLPKRPSREFL